MKLKKIASLMLAGVMAVSMLAGCKTVDNSGDNGNDDVVVTPSASAIVTAVNNGQSATNDVKIDFTSDTSLDAALTKAVEAVGDRAGRGELANYMKGLTGVEIGIDEVTELTGWTSKKHGWGLHQWTEWTLDTGFDGKVITEMAVERIDGVLSEDAALRKAAAMVDDDVAKLDATTYGKVSADDKYTDYAYAGTVSMVSAENVNGSTSYYVAYTITQTTSVKTLAPQA